MSERISLAQYLKELAMGKRKNQYKVEVAVRISHDMIGTKRGSMEFTVSYPDAPDKLDQMLYTQIAQSIADGIQERILAAAGPPSLPGRNGTVKSPSSKVTVIRKFATDTEE